jgi:hypothetical protein
MRAAVEHSVRLNAVPDDLAPAVLTLRREGVDGTFETIEEMRVTIHDDLDGLVIIVSAYFTLNHNPSFCMNVRRRLDNSTGLFSRTTAKKKRRIKRGGSQAPTFQASKKDGCDG